MRWTRSCGPVAPASRRLSRRACPEPAEGASRPRSLVPNRIRPDPALDPASLRRRPEKHFTVYSVAANYSLTLVQREGRDYVGLLEVLEPLGKVSAKSDGPRWRLRYNNVRRRFPGRQDARPHPGPRRRSRREIPGGKQSRPRSRRVAQFPAAPLSRRPGHPARRVRTPLHRQRGDPLHGVTVWRTILRAWSSISPRR